MNQGVNSKMRHGVRRRQRGAIAIIFGLMIAFLLGLVGFALDLSRVHNRRAELQAVADVAALRAARRLNGTLAGINNATTDALVAMNSLKYQYNHLSIAWDERALSFSASPNGGWVDADTARAAPAGLAYVRAATGALDASIGRVDMFFMRVLSDTLASMDVAVTAVAGRSTIDVAPLAVCALSNIEAGPRANPGPPATVELVEYGFRRGVAYDLMQLNPGGTAAENFVIDPFSPPGVAGAVANLAPALVGPYVCTGQLGMPRVTGGALTVGRPFPLASLFKQLNSRFDQYTGALCSYASAPPDTNIREYTFGAGASSGTPWMTVAPAGQAAQSTTASGKLWTVADPLPPPAGITAPMYGPLWAFARPVQYPSNTPFATSDWSALYGPGAPTAKLYSANPTAYRSTNATYVLKPPLTHKGVADRRVLNVALLACPVAAGALSTATVLGIGKFLMTVPATATSVYAEFGGLAAEQSLGGVVELYP